MWIDVEQNTDEWMDLRIGRIGGSTIGKIMANYGKDFGKPAHEAAIKMALEQIRGVSFESGYTNAHMERGHEQEPIARKLYEDTYFCEVTNGGYYAVDENIGVSPDGLVGDDGLIEIKSVIPSVHFDTVKRKAYDPKYKWQLTFNLKCSDRRWIDYVEFCSDFPEGKRLFVQRLTEKDLWEEHQQIDKRIEEFMILLQEKKDIINSI